MTTILFIEHGAMPGPDGSVAHLKARGCAIRVVRPYLGEALPDVAGLDGVILPGGPQMVTDLPKYPYLQHEIDFVSRVMDRGTPLLGICLGAQMMAHGLGARVDWHPDGAVAYGYHPVRPTGAGADMFPNGLQVLSGNAQGFSAPPGATMLAHGELWPNQAFSVGERAVAFQFHPEVTRPILDRWQADLERYIGRPGASDHIRQDADFERHDPALKAWYGGFLDRFFSLTNAPQTRS